VLFQVIALTLLGAVLVALVLFVLPASLVGADDVSSVADRLDLQNKVRGTLLQGLGGAFLFLTAFFTYRQMANARDQLEQGRREFKATRLHLRGQDERDERGQITERFSRAIDQLGEEANLLARLGGIYALETIERDNRSMSHIVEEVLCAFVRQRAPWPPGAGQPPAETRDDEVKPLRERLPDVAAALIVLSRRESSGDSLGYSLWPLDLSDVDLRRADLAAPPFTEPSGMEVKGPVRHSNFRGAFLARSCLRRARLDGADLNEANLSDADLRGASLADADLEGAVLLGARLEGATLVSAHVDPGVRSVVSYDAQTIWPADVAAG
jgi:hypothetical protein